MRSLQLLRSVVVALVALPFALPAQQRAPATQLGFSGARLTRIDSAFQRAVDSRQIAGAVAGGVARDVWLGRRVWQHVRGGPVDA